MHKTQVILRSFYILKAAFDFIKSLYNHVLVMKENMFAYLFMCIIQYMINAAHIVI